VSDIRQIPDEDMGQFVRIAADAYPSFDLPTEESRQRMVQRILDRRKVDSATDVYGLYRDGRLMGGMRLFDFPMNVLSTVTLTGGVGLVAVDIQHKKEKVAKELIEFFLRHYRERGSSLTSLYPFRPDFYRQMGYGYGAKMHQYRLRPASLPGDGPRQRTRLLGKQDQPAVAACYARYFEQTHGMIAKSEPELNRFFDGVETRVIGYEEGGQVLGYLAFQYRKGNTFLANDIEVRELIYETREALAGLMAFLHSQRDQIGSVEINTQDDYFHFLPADPRNGTGNILPSVYHESHVSGVGLMYRVIDTAGLFRLLGGRDFNGQSCRLKIVARDSFLPENDGAVVVHFADGRPQLGGDGHHEVEIQLDIAEFSSLVMGVVPFKRLYAYGLAEISDPGYLGVVNRLFETDEPPVCTTLF
jgi:predicted acetyltransferase